MQIFLPRVVKTSKCQSVPLQYLPRKQDSGTGAHEQGHNLQPRCSKSSRHFNCWKKRASILTCSISKLRPTRHSVKLINQLGITARALIRSGEDEYKAMKLSDESLSDEALVDAMVRSPKLIQRPIVVADGKAVLGRPPENILDII